MSEALLVCGGAAPSRNMIDPVLAASPFICAADSGLDTIHAWGVRPQLIVGDMDSVSDPALIDRYQTSGCRVLRLNRYKDDTDTETALQELRRLGYERVTLAGGGGGRLDHTLGLIQLFRRPFAPLAWYTDRELIVKLDCPSTFTVGKDRLISLFPLDGQGAKDMSSQGLEWSLDGLLWQPGFFGISNISTADTIRIDPGPQPLLMIINQPGESTIVL